MALTSLRTLPDCPGSRVSSSRLLTPGSEPQQTRPRPRSRGDGRAGVSGGAQGRRGPRGWRVWLRNEANWRPGWRSLCPSSPCTASGWPLTKPVAVNLLCPSPPPPSSPPTRPRLPHLTQDAWPPSSRPLAAERGAPCLPAAALGHRDTALEAEAVETQQKYEPLRGGGAHGHRGQPRSRHLTLRRRWLTERMRHTE